MKEMIENIISKLSRQFPERTYIGKNYSIGMLYKELYVILRKIEQEQEIWDVIRRELKYV